METWDETFDYAPHSGELMPDGTLRVPTFGRFADGKVWDGCIVATPEHSSYALWRSQIENKDTYWAAFEEDLRLAREQRRRESKQRKKASDG